MYRAGCWRRLLRLTLGRERHGSRSGECAGELGEGAYVGSPAAERASPGSLNICTRTARPSRIVKTK